MLPVRYSILYLKKYNIFKKFYIVSDQKLFIRNNNALHRFKYKKLKKIGCII